MKHRLASRLSLTFVVFVCLVAGCGGDNPAAPAGGATSFSRMMGEAAVDDWVADVVVTSDGLRVVTGAFSPALHISGEADSLVGDALSYDAYVVAFRDDGTVAWKRDIGGAGDETPLAAARDGNGSIFLAGSYRNQTTIAGTTLSAFGLEDALVVKLDASGNPVWAVGGGSNSFDWVDDVVPAGGGDVYVCGLAGDALVLASKVVGEAGSRSGFVERLSSLGGGVWSATATGAGSAECTSMVRAADGSVWVLGTYDQPVNVAGDALGNDGGVDGFIAHYSDLGVGLGAIQIGGTGSVALYSMVAMGNGFVVAASASGDVDFDKITSAGALTSRGLSDAFIVRYSTPGVIQWVKQFGGTDDEAAFRICRIGSDHLLVTGWFTGSITFGSHTLVSNGVRDAYLVELDANGGVVSAQAIGSAGDDSGRAVAASGESAIVVGLCEGDVKFPGGKVRQGFGRRDVFLYQR
jgi:hypothetical protein